ncbi:hypothetical protein [Aquiflexum gelatinilyticum]|uniref:hypothetical protein n=1 Tax=Aquiflexum gelatinilyticum TaxID=2961943 RepID=UPI002168EF21|nr:hypothetical protein [Aquiflexum gelatinilyticum]MCS4433400.1 hypothetical protein [Aquiflexum gelatinilyticum]
MRKFLVRFGSYKNIFFLFVLFLGFNLWILPGMMTGEKPLDLEINYTAEEAYSRLSRFSEEIRESYRMGLMVSDMIYPIVYSLLFSFIIFKLWQNEMIALLPFTILVFDFIENFSIITMLGLFPEKSIFWGTLAGISTSLKWFFTAITLIFVVIGFGKKTLEKKS